VISAIGLRAGRWATLGLLSRGIWRDWWDEKQGKRSKRNTSPLGPRCWAVPTLEEWKKPPPYRPTINEGPIFKNKGRGLTEHISNRAGSFPFQPGSSGSQLTVGVCFGPRFFKAKNIPSWSPGKTGLLRLIVPGRLMVRKDPNLTYKLVFNWGGPPPSPGGEAVGAENGSGCF